MLSPPQLAAGLLAFIAAGLATWLTSGHQPLPSAGWDEHVSMAFTAFDKAVDEPLQPRIVKAIPVPKPGSPEAAELFLTADKPTTAIKTNMTEREELAIQAKNVCERHGGRHVEFIRHHHAMWRCVYRQRHQHHHRHRKDDD